jgi:hypothetical protein
LMFGEVFGVLPLMPISALVELCRAAGYAE